MNKFKIDYYNTMRTINYNSATKKDEYHKGNI